ncbi:hypothetical protein GcC1_221033, partial [Golovinomyces cichoracearum]
MDNGLFIACGEKGHSARDHHRKNNLIPMPKRPLTHPPDRNFAAPVKNHQQHSQPTPIPAYFYPHMQFFNHQFPQPFPPTAPHSYSPHHLKNTATTRLRAIDDDHESGKDKQPETSNTYESPYNQFDELK